jgi:hypothetical protein
MLTDAGRAALKRWPQYAVKSTGVAEAASSG